ncbi:hypothetical protein HOLleu_41847 [Holothuria leucospilota]|uniref:Uncharacterized protein n=1 Tax=Holothuria leucospilota TaxID=206669 RepID=A0A9Q0YC26_HOLLE|nr:hypothetical protein HOLleu_41847 [Holothuria leucospilota]
MFETSTLSSSIKNGEVSDLASGREQSYCQNSVTISLSQMSPPSKGYLTQACNFQQCFSGKSFVMEKVKGGYFILLTGRK